MDYLGPPGACGEATRSDGGQCMPNPRAAWRAGASDLRPRRNVAWCGRRGWTRGAEDEPWLLRVVCSTANRRHSITVEN